MADIVMKVWLVVISIYGVRSQSTLLLYDNDEMWNTLINTVAELRDTVAAQKTEFNQVSPSDITVYY